MEAESQARPGSGAAPLQTRQEWFQALAEGAWVRGQRELAGSDPAEALRWLERAHRLAPEDGAISLSLATARLPRDPDGAGALLEDVLRHADWREAWLLLATIRRLRGEAAGSAAALAEALARHAVPDLTAIASLADAVAAEAGWPGWCGLHGDGRLVVHALGPGGPAQVAFDGRPVEKTNKVPDGVTEVSVTRAGRPLLGSPVAVARIRRADGVVLARDGGLEGWAWHPADPDTDPVLTIAPPGAPRGTSPGAKQVIRLRATDTSMPAPVPLARPRRFHVPAARLAGWSGPLHVRGRDGRDLPGSPLDPGSEARSAAAAALVVARLFPAGPGRGSAPAGTEPAAPAATRGPAAAAKPAPRRRLAVVVPVHGGQEVTRRCLEAVFATIPSGTAVIVIDDASPEPELRRMLEQYRRERRIRLLQHAVNRGFPASANAGLREAAALPGQPDVVLLNSDAIVPAGWLERLRAVVHATADIGTATPLSNDATILSYPAAAGGNPVPDAAALARLARQADAANAGVVVDIPTAVGFCMYVRRECLEATGLFREDLFAQGYGEENDFCIRARHLGWRHVAVPGVYVAHIGAQSFGAASPGRQALIARNLDVLERLHPGYHALIAAFGAADPLAPARRRLDAVRWRAGRRAQGSAILLTHDSGGGVERVVRARAAALRATGLRPILLRPVTALDGTRLYHPGLVRVEDEEGGFPNLVFTMPGEVPALARLLSGDRPAFMEAHHLLGHDHAILGLAERLGIPLDMHVHDYALFCPRITLVGRESRYCGEPEDTATCEACVADAGRHVDEVIPVAALRARSAADLAAARRVVVPSADAATRLRRHFPETAPELEPPEDDGDLPPPAVMRGAAPRLVCLVGAIGPEKGYDMLLACARDAAARNLPLRFTLVGHTPDDARLFDTGRVFVTGPYRDAEAVALIQAQQAHLGWLPSIWPETWCFTLSHAWRAGLGVAAFDIGAPAERIRRNGRGWLLPLGLPPPAVNNALLAVRIATGDEWQHFPNVA